MSPSPCNIAPMRFILSFLLIIVIKTPTNAMKVNRAVYFKSRPRSGNRRNEAVIVVPMFAPIMTEAAWVSVISPTLTKPTIITVVADEDWTIAVTAAPVPTPKKAFWWPSPSVCASICPQPIRGCYPSYSIPTMKVATPPNKNSIQFTTVRASAEPNAKRESNIKSLEILSCEIYICTYRTNILLYCNLKSESLSNEIL